MEGLLPPGVHIMSDKSCSTEDSIKPEVISNLMKMPQRDTKTDRSEQDYIDRAAMPPRDGRQ